MWSRPLSVDPAAPTHLSNNAPMILMRFAVFCLLTLVAAVTLPGTVSANEALEASFREHVRSVLRQNCFECHDANSAEGDLDLSGDRDVASVTKNFKRWSVVLERLKAGDMPPEDSEQRPTDEQREQLIEWIEQLRDTEACADGG